MGAMEELLKLETEKLIRSWMEHEPEHLSAYLVSGVEDPRINLQSVLTRHFMTRELFPGRFEMLMQEECRFAAALNWLNRPGPAFEDMETRAAILHALRQGSDNAEGLPISEFLLNLFQNLPLSADSIRVPNYLEMLLAPAAKETGSSIDSETAQTFQRIWRSVLSACSREARGPFTVLEPAAGSANEYRFLDSYGIAPFLNYTGFDLCEKNVVNARALFPENKFEC